MSRVQGPLLSLIGGIVLLVLGGCVMLLGIAFFFSINEPDTEMTFSTALCTVFLGLPFAALGSGIAYFAQKSYRRNRNEEVEAKILAAAIERNYRITVAEAAMMTDLSLEESRRYLEQLARTGQVSVELDDKGTLIYCFRDAKL